MNPLKLPGLKGTESIGFLAAIGLLRVLGSRHSFGSVSLSWSDDSVWSAVLHTKSNCDEQRLIDDLLAYMQRRVEFPVFAGVKPSGEPFKGGPWRDVKVPADQFAEMLRAVRNVATSSDREAADFYSSLGSELVSLGNKDAVKPSALHMTSGNQAFLETLRELVQSLDPTATPHPKSAIDPEDAFREAIFDYRSTGSRGWQATDEFSAMGFDANREAIYALTATAPTYTGPRSTRAAVWLAVEAFPLFTTIPVRGRLHTRGFRSNQRSTTFRFPIWNGDLTIDAIRTLLGYIDRIDGRLSVEQLNQLCIRAIMASERVTIGQGYGQLRPAVRV